MSAPSFEHRYDGSKSIVLSKWKVQSGSRITPSTVIFTYTDPDDSKEELKFKSSVNGTVRELMVKEGNIVRPNDIILCLESCKHEVIIKELCAECGADLRQLDSQNLQEVVASRSFSMVHVVPELKCSLEQARQLDEADVARLLKTRKLILLVDLDQTLIHTTNENVPPDLKNVHHFQLYGPRSPWYHTKLRPHTQEFLEKISQLYELHIFTFGARMYAHKIASILDPDRKLFSHRILSRDECFDATSKTGNLKSLFPRGDSMVCIIDDREDVWNFAPNVVHVKPYIYFRNTGDINSPPGAMGRRTGEPNSTPGSKSQTSYACADSTTTPPEPMETSDISQEQDPQNVVSTTLEEDLKDDCDSAEPGNVVEKKETINSFTYANDEAEVSSSDQLGGTEPPEQNAAENPVENAPEKGEIVETSVQHPAAGSRTNAVDEGDDDDDDFLLYLEEILVRIHKAYYELHDEMVQQNSDRLPDLKSVIPYVKRKVLQGVNIVFSGVIPMNLSPEKSSVWLLAKSLGANIAYDLRNGNQTNPTTHLIASKIGTSKLNRAKRAGNIHIVTPNWLFCCAMRWERADERLFPLKKNSNPSSPEIARKCKKVQRNRRFRQGGCKLPRSSQDRASSPSSSWKTDNQEVSEDSQNASDDPLSSLTFSVEDLQDMDKEVDEACATDDEEDDVDSKESFDSDCSSSSLASSFEGRAGKRLNSSELENAETKRFKSGSASRKHRGEETCPEIANFKPDLNSTDSGGSSSSTTTSVCSEDEELAAAVEKQLFDS